MRKFRDFLICMICICMVVTMFPVRVFADEYTGEETEEQQGLTEDERLEQELFEKYGDDPGNGRLAGRIPEEFYDGVAVFSTRASYTHNSRFDGYTIQKGIDVSHHQGTINWEKVKDAGIKFAIIRVGYRGYGDAGNLADDRCVTANLKGAISAGIPVGVYIYSQAITEAEAREEANFVLKKIKGYNIELPVVMDYEYYGSNEGRLYKAKLSRRKATDNCLAFCKVVEDAGYKAMVYANKSFLSNQLYADEISSKYEIWLANYTTSTSYTGDYSYWQYSSTGTVNGINGNVDMNFHYIAPDPDPHKLEVSKTTLDSVTLQWKASNSSEVSGYEIEKKNDAGKFDVLTEISDPAQLTYTDTGLKQGTAYTYRVRAFYCDSDEETAEKIYGEYSEPVTSVTGIDATTSITDATSTYDSVKLTWQKVSNVSGYQIQRYNSSKKAYESLKKVNALTYTNTGLNSNTTYKYRIRPYKTVGDTTVYGAFSEVKSIKTVLPSKGVSNAKVNVRSGASTSKSKLGTISKGTIVSITGTSGDWYKVTVTISGKTKNGYISKQYITITSTPSKTIMTAKGTAFDKVKLTWEKVSGASGYVVQRYNSSKAKYETVKTITSGLTVSYIDGSRNSSTTYKYRVRAYKTYSGTKIYGSYSTVVSGKTKASVTGKTTSKVNIRKGAGTSYKSYKTVKKGTKLTISGSSGSWYRVSITVSGQKKNAYVLKKYVKL